MKTRTGKSKLTRLQCRLPLFTFCALILLNGSPLGANESWGYLGLGHVQVNELIIYGDSLYACTRDGLYRRSLSQNDTLWHEAGFQGQEVASLFISDDNRRLVHTRSRDSQEAAIYIAEDGSPAFELLLESYHRYRSDGWFRMMDVSPDFMHIYNLSMNLKSHDGGQSWQAVLANETDAIFRFIKLDREQPGIVWIGGESLGFFPILLYADNYGDDFEWLPLYASFFNGDNATHWLIRDQQKWYVPGEGIICMSQDQGQTWHTLINAWGDPDMDMYMFDLAFSPRDKNIMYATGDSYCPYIGSKVNILVSHDRGLSWTHHGHDFNRPDALKYIRTMVVFSDNEADVVYIGGSGVYKISPDDLPSGIPDNETEARFQFWPNPVGQQLNIHCEAAGKHPVLIQLFDQGGRLILQKNMASANLQLSTMHLPAGFYMIRLQGNDFTESRKLSIAPARAY